MNVMQQGDVFIEAAEIPEGAKRQGDISVLAEGEVTGHAHRLTKAVPLFLAGAQRYIQVPERLTLKHEEHGAITVDAGTYAVRIVREYDHFAEEARAVAD